MQSLLSGDKKRRYAILAACAIVPIMLIMIVMFALTSVFDYKLNRNAEHQIVAFTRQAADSVANRITAMENTIGVFMVQSSDPQELLPVLDSLKMQMGFSSVAFADMSGTGIQSGGEPFDVSQIPYTETALSCGVFSYSDTFIADDGMYTRAIQKPLYINETQIGALYIQVPLKILMAPKYLNVADGRGYSILFEAQSGEILVSPSQIKNTSVPETMTLYSFLEKSTYQSLAQVPESKNCAEGSLFGYTYERDKNHSNDLADLRSIIRSGKSALMIASVNGRVSYVDVAPVAHGAWYMCSIIPMENVQAETAVVTTIFHIALGIGIICLVIVGALFLVTYRRRVRERYVTMLTQLYQALSDSVDLAVNLYSFENNTVTPFVAKEAGVIGYTLDEFLSDMHLADEAGLSQEGRNLLKRLKNGLITEFEQGEFSLQPQNDLERWVSYSVRPLTFGGKRQVLIVIRDSTADKRIQLSMKEAMCAAEAANQAKTDFLSRMSHEMRTPLNVVIGMLQIAWKDVGNVEKTKDNLAKIGTASEHLLSLINDVLDLSKIENGNTTLSLETFRLSDMIDHVANVIRPCCEQRKQKFIVRSDSQTNGVYKGDAIRLKQMLVNLLSNASKYTPEHGCITLETKVSSGPVFGYRQITFIVSDNGIGMSDDFMERLFEPFAMEGRSQAQGTGLGMSIVKNIVTMMGGAIEVDSALGKGSVFTVVLALRMAFETERLTFEETSSDRQHDAEGCECKTGAEEPQGENTYSYFIGSSETDSADIVGLAGAHILLAEDNDLNAEIMCELLSRAGLDVDRARDGEEACAMFGNSACGYYDVILMDVQMPNMNGHDATRRIRAFKRADACSIPIIAMSANAFSEDVCASLASGMDAHLSKPVEINRALAVITKYVYKYRVDLSAEESTDFTRAAKKSEESVSKDDGTNIGEEVN